MTIKVKNGGEWIEVGGGGGGSNPAGTVIYSASSTIPDGYLKANGASVSTTTYADLFSAIGYTYGGSGSSFNLPDLRGEFIRGWDDGRGADIGRTFGSFQSWAIQNITGTLRRLNFLATGSGAFTSGQNYGGNENTSGGTNAYGVDFNAARVVQTANETRPRNRALLALIKY